MNATSLNLKPGEYRGIWFPRDTEHFVPVGGYLLIFATVEVGDKMSTSGLLTTRFAKLQYNVTISILSNGTGRITEVSGNSYFFTHHGEQDIDCLVISEEMSRWAY